MFLFLQACGMFLGEMLCMIAFWVSKFMAKRRPQQPFPPIGKLLLGPFSVYISFGFYLEGVKLYYRINNTNFKTKRTWCKGRIIEELICCCLKLSPFLYLTFNFDIKNV